MSNETNDPWSDTEEQISDPSKYCDICEKWFSRVDSAKRHKKIVHGGDQRSLLINYRCHYCVSNVTKY